MKKIFLLSCCFMLLTACQATKKNTAEQQKLLLQTNIDKQVESLILPKDIEDELYADLALQPEVLTAPEKRFDIAARDVEAALFFGSLFSDTSYSVAVHPGVKGSISLSLKQVTLVEALGVIEDMFGYDIKLKGRVYHIYPADMRIANFTLDYLFMNRMGGSRTTVSSGHLTEQSDSDSDSDSDSSSDSDSDSSTSTSSDMQNKEFTGSFSSNNLDDGTEIITVTSTNYWAYLEAKIRALLGQKPGRDVIVSPMSGMVTVRAYPNELSQVKAFLERETDNLNRQVILEMQLIEVSLNDDYQQGISWDRTGDIINSTNILFDSVHQIANNVIKNTIGGGGALTIESGSFSAVVKMLATQGDVNVLSKPRITAMNNQKAMIKIGGDEYFVTDVSTTTVTGTSTTSTPNVELTPFFSGISVDVTPKINDDDSVLLHIHPAITDIQEQTKTISFGGVSGDLTLPLAKSDVRETDTVVKAMSGDVIVIGGLMKTVEKDIVSKTPLLGDIPWVGEIFTNREKVNSKTELVILVKPLVIKKNTWKQELQKSSELIEKWYPEK